MKLYDKLLEPLYIESHEGRLIFEHCNINSKVMLSLKMLPICHLDAPAPAPKHIITL